MIFFSVAIGTFSNGLKMLKLFNSRTFLLPSDIGVLSCNNFVRCSAVCATLSNNITVRRFYVSKKKKGLRKHRRANKMAEEIVASIEKDWNDTRRSPNGNFKYGKKRVHQLLVSKIREDVSKYEMQQEYRRSDSSRNKMIEHYKSLSLRLDDLREMRDLKEKILYEEKLSSTHNLKHYSRPGTPIENQLERDAFEAMKLNIENSKDTQFFLPNADLLSEELNERIKSCVKNQSNEMIKNYEQYDSNDAIRDCEQYNSNDMIKSSIQHNSNDVIKNCAQYDSNERCNEKNTLSLPIVDDSVCAVNVPNTIGTLQPSVSAENQVFENEEIQYENDDDDFVYFETLEDARKAGMEVSDELVAQAESANREIQEDEGLLLSPLTYKLRRLRLERQAENEYYNQNLQHELVCPMPLSVRDVIKLHLRNNAKVPIRFIDPYKPPGMTLLQFFEAQGLIGYVRDEQRDSIESLLAFSENEESHGDVQIEKYLSGEERLPLHIVNAACEEQQQLLEEEENDSNATRLPVSVQTLGSEVVYDFRKLIRERKWSEASQYCEALRDSILNGENPLHICVILDEFEGLNDALACGAFNVDDCNDHRMTPLHMAALRGSVTSCEKLISYKANLNYQDDEGFTALHYAFAMGFGRLAQFLMTSGAAIDICDSQSANVLHIASQAGHLNLVEMALRAGLSVDAVTLGNETALLLACEANMPSVVELLLRNNANWSIPNENGLSALHAAVKSNALTVVRLLLRHGANANSGDHSGNTPLHYAALQGNVDICRHLVVGTTQLNTQNSEGWTALHLAVQSGHANIVAFLVGVGSKINLRNDEGATPLLVALCTGHIDIARSLISHGADINAGNASNITPIYLAIQESHLEFAEEIIALHADIHCRTIDGVSTLHVAIEYEHIDLANRLLDLGVNPFSPTSEHYEPIHFATAVGSLQLVQRLLDLGANPNTYSKDGINPLSIAESDSNEDMISLLKSYGAKHTDVFDMI